MANSLIIGLGGTGGKIIREFRKRYYEEFKSLDNQAGTYVEYLYVDSDENDLKTNWKVQGKSIGLNPAEKVSTHGMNLSDLDQLHERPTLNGFINPNEVDLIKEKLGKVINEGIGGQRRRLGRMLLASHNMQQGGFVNQLKGRVDTLRNESHEDQVHFHIVAGLAGGTGSGSVIDAVAQVRELGDNNTIHLYLYVPEQQPVYLNNIDYYKANGYAALLEINAMLTDNYSPVNIQGRKDIYQQAEKLQKSQPVNGTYLFTNVNENGKTLPLNTDLPTMVGDFLFQKIVLDPHNDKLKRIEKFENGDVTDESDATGKRTRSIKFLSFGYRRVIFPEEEIKEHIAYTFAEKASFQMLYQKWTAQGYVDSSAKEAASDIVSSLIRDERDAMFLNDKILMRESTLPGTDPVLEFEMIFKNPSDNYLQEAKKMEKADMLKHYNTSMSDFFKRKFRKVGVVDYFAQETADASKYATKIVSEIQKVLFQRWENGTYGAVQVEEYVKLLIDDCDKRVTDFSKKRQLTDKEIEETGKKRDDAGMEVSKSRIFGNAFGKRDEKFDEYATLVKNYYVSKTRNEAYRYAITLLGAVKVELQSLKNTMETFTALFKKVSEKAEIEANERCREDEGNDVKTLRKYDRAVVKEITEFAIRNETSQKIVAGNVRNELVNHIKESSAKSFESFLKTYDAADGFLDTAAEEILDDIMKVCDRAAEKEVDERSYEKQQYKVTNVNILEKIRHEYGEGEKLLNFARELMDSAQTFVRFNSSEENRQANGNINRKANSVIVYLPEEKDDSGFRDKLAKAFKEAKGGVDVTIVNSHRPDQIAVMTLSSQFPLRYVDNVKSLKEAYDALVKDPNNPVHKLVLHTETFGEPLPSLFEASVDEMKIEVPKIVLLAFAMGLIKEGTDPITGRRGYYYYYKDKYGDDSRSDSSLGKTFQDVARDLPKYPTEFAKIKADVETRLKNNYRHVDNKAELMNAVNNILRTLVLDAVNGDEFHPDYVKYKNTRNELGDKELSVD